MNIERLKTIIETYGSDSDSWPDEERQAALALLKRSDEGSRLIIEAQRFDRLLDGYAPQPIDQNKLRQQILSSIETAESHWLKGLIEWLSPDVDELLGSIWRPALAAAMTVTLGISIGIATVEDSTILSDTEEIQLMAFSATDYEGWTDE